MPESRNRKKTKKKKKPEPKWASFERVVAAIHLASSEGAEVMWNEKIEGREFDVSIKFKHGYSKESH